MSKDHSQKLAEIINPKPDLLGGGGTGKQPSLKKLREVERMLTDLVWYNRHENRRIAIEEGKVVIMDSEDSPRPKGKKRTILREIWERAQKAALKIEKRYGEENLGPWDDFEWGMINGKLSAVRWMTGEEWDDLET